MWHDAPPIALQIDHPTVRIWVLEGNGKLRLNACELEPFVSMKHAESGSLIPAVVVAERYAQRAIPPGLKLVVMLYVGDVGRSVPVGVRFHVE